MLSAMKSRRKGRGREFHQFNVDILGEAGPGADAELIALAIETMLSFGFVEGDFVVRVSDRNAWLNFAKSKNVEEEKVSDFLGLVDKLDREKPEVLNREAVCVWHDSRGGAGIRRESRKRLRGL